MTAPWGWKNWTAAQASESRVARLEMSLYSDSRFVGELRDLGPYSVLNTAPGVISASPGLRTQPLVIRIDQHIDVDATPQLEPGNPKTNVAGYHGGWVADELAALLSLTLGARCQNGGLIRTWWGPESDPLGSPSEFDHMPPFLPPPPHARAAVLPEIAREVHLDQARSLLLTYPAMAPKQASALVRAARLYQSAIWIADGDPSLSWLQLVSALEAVAAHEEGVHRTAYERVRAAWPELGDALGRAEDSVRDEISTLVAPQVKATNRVIDFVAKYQPPPPSTRPDQWAQIDWDALPELVRRVYHWRSRALHDGIPMPAPMCTAPLAAGSSPSEGGGAGGYGAAGGTWTGRDVPMLLHTFAYIVRGCLLKWWNQLSDTSPSLTRPSG